MAKKKRRPRLVPQRPAELRLPAGRPGRRGRGFTQRPTDPGVPGVVCESLTQQAELDEGHCQVPEWGLLCAHCLIDF
jgi:hypothetical protein